MSWLFDRKAVPVSVLSDSDMRAIHIGTAEFFWPEEWESQMPTVDENVQAFLEELQMQVKYHLNRCDGHRYRATRGGNLSTDELSQVMRLLNGSLTAIFKAADISELSVDDEIDDLSDILPSKFAAVDRSLFKDQGWERAPWQEKRSRMLSALAQWNTPDPDKTLYETVLDRAAVSPLTDVCDALGAVVVPLPVDEEKLSPYCFVDPIGPPTAEGSSTASTLALPTILEATKGPSNDGEGSGQGNSRSTPPQSTSSSRDNVSSLDAFDISRRRFRYDFSEPAALAESVGELTLQESGGPCSWLELPLLVAVYQKRDTDRIKTQNQHRLYSTAAARFLETIGITRQPVFGVMSDGPVAVLTSTWVDGEYVHIFEEHIESFDISTAFGAWHYATVLARIAVKYGPKLVE
ncbi:hypothetical protein WOLCODRAFT_154702 [Wolfiporia cocos MD-104 SS10]|uniref:Uncharacterized protein n=1 Tax=Wolfiporia cocos (strain MD-104) TaxID=742152 RepID=A0A2H3JR78_WOLCO|nr:hypothetical protein WOLCODRAFT_154702 [Wolfiporia cocos MD-104 SS10]